MHGCCCPAGGGAAAGGERGCWMAWRRHTATGVAVVARRGEDGGGLMGGPVGSRERIMERTVVLGLRRGN